MASMMIKEGEIFTIASGIYESYDRAGPFVACKDFDLEAFVETSKASISENWEVQGLRWEIPRRLVAAGYIAAMPCRKIYLGSFDEIELGDEKDEFDS